MVHRSFARGETRLPADMHGRCVDTAEVDGYQRLGLHSAPCALTGPTPAESMAGMKRLLSALILLAPWAAHAQQPAPTFESQMAQGQTLRTSHREAQAADAFWSAARLAQQPAKRAHALGEIAELSLAKQWFRMATDASCQALESVSGPARASHLYNLGRVAEAVSETKQAVALYQSSLALRPNDLVAARLKSLRATPAASPPADVAPAFCTAALRPRAAIPGDLLPLAEQVAKRRDEKVKFVQVRALGGQGEQYPVVFLCAPDAESGGWIIAVDATHRYLVAVDSISGRDELQACREEDTRQPVLVGHGRYNALEFVSGHRGGYNQYRIAVRGGRPVVVWEQELDDARAGDSPTSRDYDQPGRSYPSIDTLMGKVRAVLIDPNNLKSVE